MSKPGWVANYLNVMEGDQVIAVAQVLTGEDNAINKAWYRAKLMAAAPALYKSLTELVEELTSVGGPESKALTNARLILFKAREELVKPNVGNRFRF